MLLLLPWHSLIYNSSCHDIILFEILKYCGRLYSLLYLVSIPHYDIPFFYFHMQTFLNVVLDHAKQFVNRNVRLKICQDINAV
jgi:hypothetical protein